MTTPPTRLAPGIAQRTNVSRVLLEASLAAAIGAVLALLANQLSPAGLKLSRPYFPKVAVGATPAPTPTNAVSTASRLQAKGLQPLGHTNVLQWFSSPEYAQDQVVFVDARDDLHYQAGHIPGAYQFDHYHPENYIAAVLPACLAARKIVVYCTGGDCEDSEFAAITLTGAGLAREKLFIYTGGVTEWKAAGQALETGARRSGQLLDAKP